MDSAPTNDQMEEDERLIDPNTMVRNLKTNRLVLREKLFVDKSIRKQLEVTMEEKTQSNPYANPSYNVINRQNTKGYFSNEMIAMVRNHNQTYQGDRTRLDSDGDQFANYDEEEMKQNSAQYKKEEDFLYGQISGSGLETFQVIKFNKKNKAKEIILEIDGFNVSHRKMNEKSGFFSSILPDSILKGGR